MAVIMMIYTVHIFKKMEDICIRQLVMYVMTGRKKMTDKEWIKNIKNISDKELLESLEYMYASYYPDLVLACVKELRRRLKVLRKRQNEQA